MFFGFGVINCSNLYMFLLRTAAFGHGRTVVHGETFIHGK